MLNIEMADSLDHLWQELIESEVTLNLPPIESHREYNVRFVDLNSQSESGKAYRCEITIAEHNRDVAKVKVSARDGAFAIRQCLQRARRDLQRRTLFSNDRSRLIKASDREWSFS